MIYAQIKNNRIQNTIVLDDEALIPIFLAGFDALLRVDNISPAPQVGWIYNSNTNKFSFCDHESECTYEVEVSQESLIT